MRIVMVGVGAMASVYGGYLHDAGHDVRFVSSGSPHVRAMAAGGLRITGIGGDRVLHPRVAEPTAGGDLAEVIFVLPKTYGTASAAERVASFCGRETVFVTLQNGYGNAEVLVEHFGDDRVFAGVSYHGAEVVEPGSVRHSAAGETVLGPWANADPDRAHGICRVLRDAGIDATPVADVRGAIWGKLLVNASVNPVAALTGSTCAELPSSDDAWPLVERLMTEGVAVAARENVDLPYRDPVGHVRSVMQMAGEARLSMLQDIEGGRRTEVDAINGAIVELADSHGLDVPANRTVTSLIRAIDAGHAAS